MKKRETKEGQESLTSTKLEVFSFLLHIVTLYRDLFSIGFLIMSDRYNLSFKKKFNIIYYVFGFSLYQHQH